MADWIATLPSWMQSLPEGIQSILFDLYRTFVRNANWKMFASGLKITLICTVGALAIGIVIGLILAVIRTLNDSYTVKKPPFVLRLFNRIALIYISIIRGTPMMVQLLLMGFVIWVPKGDTATLACGIVTLGLNSGAYVAEIFRSGLMSVDKGQTEAGRSLGFSYIRTMWYIVIPQAIKNILPALGNEMITLFKDTSLVSVIAIRDMTKQAQNIMSNIYTAIVPYVSLAVIYLVIVLLMTKGLNIFEKRLRKSEH